MVGRLKLVLPALVALALAGSVPVGATPLVCLSVTGTGNCTAGPIDVTPGGALSLELILNSSGDPIDGYGGFTVDELVFETSVLSLSDVTGGSLADLGFFTAIFDTTGMFFAIGDFLAGATGYGSILQFEFDVIGSGAASLVFNALGPGGPVALRNALGDEETGAADGLSLPVNSQGNATVPEPATFALIGFGLTGAALRLRSRRRGPFGR
jgi:hypothetical protein